MSNIFCCTPKTIGVSLVIWCAVSAWPVFAQKKGEKKEKSASTASMQAYEEKVPGSDQVIKMQPIPAGTFLMGSPHSEAKRTDDEGPQRQVSVEAFYMAQYEITWDIYDAFVSKESNGSLDAAFVQGNFAGKNLVDAVAVPSQPYVDMSFGMGRRGFPAINMTQYAALAFCKWLTAHTGRFYRLPTEAEWEYACRAGSQTAYHFGNDPAQLDEYAWYYQNSDGAYKPVGQKKPNAWGLYDMHGNVAEWTLEQYVPEAYQSSKLYNPAEKLHPVAVRGGSWDDDPDRLRSAARRGSQPDWKRRDPQIPRSRWWFTDAPFVGFRVISPVKQPSKEEIEQYFRIPPADL